MLYKISLVLHIIAGFSALLCGLLAILAAKGARLHRVSGLIYFMAMLLVSFSAVLISIMKSNSFLLHIGIFAFFMAYSGFRSIKNKSLNAGIWDWLVLLLGLINAVFMVFSLKMVLLVFGLLGLYLCLADFRLFLFVLWKKEIAKNQWLLRHIGMMLGCYISTFTAFLVVNVDARSYAIFTWLLPTFIGTPLIAFWIRKFTIKKQVADV
jgi:uncharacterized membrane protein